jgi:hypothetical protein
MWIFDGNVIRSKKALINNENSMGVRKFRGSVGVLLACAFSWPRLLEAHGRNRTHFLNYYVLRTYHIETSNPALLTGLPRDAIQ